MTEQQTIEIKDGNVFFDKHLFEEHFRNLETVMLLLRDGCLWILPVQHRGGNGLLMDVVTTNGDRFVQAKRFLRANNLEHIIDGTVPVKWDQEADALCVEIDDVTTDS